MDEEQTNLALGSSASGARMEIGQEMLISHRPLIRAYLRHQTSRLSEEDIEDLLQDICLAVWRSYASFAHRATLGTWIIGIARNVMGSWLRNQKRHHQREWQARLGPAYSETQNCESDCTNCVTAHDALAQLPSGERTLLILRYFQGLNDQEISVMTHLALGTVKGRIRAGLAHLRSVL